MKAGNIFRSRKMILLYHRIASPENDPWSMCVTPEHFAAHLEIIRKHSPVRLDQIQQPGGLLNRRGYEIAVTFDDGYADNFLYAKPLLERFEIPTTFFITTGYIEGCREFWWDELERIVFHGGLWSNPIELTAGGKTCPVGMESESARKPLYFSLYDFLQPLTHDARLVLMDQLLHAAGEKPFIRPSHRVLRCDELRKLASTGLFEIGAHTLTHPKLSAQSTVTQHAELRGSKSWLEELLGEPIKSFAYPYGGSHHYTKDTVDLVRETGFYRAVTTAGRRVENTDGPLELPRFNITDMDGKAFEKLLFH